MRLAALLERTPSGWRGWVPALPGVEVEARTASAAEEDLERAIEEHVRRAWAAGSLASHPEIRGVTIEVRLRPAEPARRPLERQGEEEKRQTLRRLDAVLADGARIPRDLLNAVFAYRHEVHDELCDEDDGPAAEAEERGGGNVVPFSPRER